MDKTDITLMLVMVGMVFGTLYGSYRLGRRLERRDLTMAIVAQVEDIYNEGRINAEHDCRDGLIK